MTEHERRQSPANSIAFILFAGLSGFCAYFSMYAFRKPFSAATFETVAGWTWEIDYKVVLVIAQVAGYALSKWIGVKVIAETGTDHRARAILGLIGLSWLALVLFAVVPAPWNVAALFLNGLPLGLIWGLVFSYMEGRRTSEALGAILCASFILSSGVVKSVGMMLLQVGVDEFWMPAAAGAVFAPLLVVSVLGLSRIAPPDADDEAARIRRAPMTASDRRAFFRRHGVGLVLLVVAYVLFTALRDFRDNFSAELWAALGYGDTASMFAASELPVAVVALVALGSLILIRDNVRALLVIHAMIAFGAVTIGLSTLAFQTGWLTSPLAWMILSGAGLYIAYTPFNAMLFDRLIAASGQIANAGFLIYVADASGYIGSVGLLLYRSLATPSLDWLEFFVTGAQIAACVSLVLVLASAIYFICTIGARTRDAVRTTSPAGE